MAYRPCPFLGLTEVIAISRDKQLARAVRREPRLTAVGHLEASRERERRERGQQKTHLEKGRKYQAYVEDDRMGRGKSSAKAATANGGTN